MAADKKKLDFSQAGIKGIMNPKSRSVKKRRVELIDYDDIVANPENKYSISDVVDLAESIAADGLRQPLELSVQDVGKYKLLAGDRR